VISGVKDWRKPGEVLSSSQRAMARLMAHVQGVVGLLQRASQLMAVKDLARIGRMTNVERLITLFRAFRERDDETFHRAAEAIIADELTANHHSQAIELQKALANGAKRPLQRNGTPLTVLPKDRRYGEALVQVVQPRADSNRVILAPEPRAQIERVVSEHSQRLKLAKYGYLPKSKLLFWGPPGCGKTLTAHLIASQLGLPLGVVRLNTLITSFLGETASHIQRVFDLAQSTPMVLLLDEADAVAKDRDDSNDVGELKRVVNSLLQAMDSFQSAESVVIAASNHQYLLDDALWRRFDDVVVFPMPAPAQLKGMLTVLLNGVNLAGNLDALAKKLSGLSFGQVEKGVIESIKTMILEDRSELRTADLTAYFKKYRTAIHIARTRIPKRSGRGPQDE
jgi:SpoVK/Ycf46/Vps4 family AAA+-type ATPase